MSTEKWTPAYGKNRKANPQFHLEDGTWGTYSIGIYDDRDIMSDSVRPSWSRSGEYMIEIVPAGSRHNSDKDFTVYADLGWANKIAYNINIGRFKTGTALKEALRKLGKSNGTYSNCGYRESVRLFENLK